MSNRIGKVDNGTLLVTEYELVSYSDWLKHLEFVKVVEIDKKPIAPDLGSLFEELEKLLLHVDYVYVKSLDILSGVFDGLDFVDGKFDGKVDGRSDAIWGVPIREDSDVPDNEIVVISKKVAWNKEASCGCDGAKIVVKIVEACDD